MHVSVVIPTFRRPKALRLTLDALARSQPPPDEVVVVDDAAEPGTSAVVEPFRDRLRITLLSQERRGAAAARNAGARAAGGELLLFLDDDMLVEPAHIAAHVATHGAFANAMVGSDRWYSPAALALLE